MRTLVIGASLKPNRYSNMAIVKLKQFQIETVAVGLKSGLIEDVFIETEKKIFDNIHTVTLYLNPKHQEEYYDYIISLNPKRVIFNPGTENFTLYKLLNTHGIKYEIACTLVLLSTNQY